MTLRDDARWRRRYAEVAEAHTKMPARRPARDLRREAPAGIRRFTEAFRYGSQEMRGALMRVDDISDARLVADSAGY